MIPRWLQLALLICVLAVERQALAQPVITYIDPPFSALEGAGAIEIGVDQPLTIAEVSCRFGGPSGVTVSASAGPTADSAICTAPLASSSAALDLGLVDLAIRATSIDSGAWSTATNNFFYSGTF